jgi:hypothetical protein
MNIVTRETRFFYDVRSSNQVKEVMGEAFSTHGRDEKYKMLVGKAERKRPRVRPRRRCEDNIRMVKGKGGFILVFN